MFILQKTGVVVKRINEKLHSFPSDSELKLIDENGKESICSVFHLLRNESAVRFGPAFSIEEMGKDFCPVISNNFSVHTAKDSHGNMTGVYIVCKKNRVNNYTYSYKIELPKPAKIKFARRIVIQKGVNNLPYPNKAVDIWQISYLDGKKELFIQGIGCNEYFTQFKIACTDYNF